MTTIFSDARLRSNLVGISSLAILLALQAAPAAASTMICPDEIEVAIDPLTCDAVIPASASGDAAAFTVLLSGIDNTFITGNGTTEVTVDFDGLFASSPAPLPFAAQATFIFGAPGVVGNQCTSNVLLTATTAGRVGEAGNSVSCICPPGSVDTDSDGLCDQADRCPGDESNTCGPADATTIFACMNLASGKVYALSSSTEPACKKDDQLLSWGSSFIGE